MTNQQTDISVVIVSYKCLPVLRMTLVSLRKAMTDLLVDVYLVDNASHDGTVEYVKEHFPWVELIESKENLGFSRANNLALDVCRGKVILVLNPDTIVPHDFLHNIVEHFESNPKCGAMGVQMTNGRGEYLKESKRGYPKISTSFYKLSRLWHLFPKSATINAYYIGNCDKDSICQAPILSGACVAFTAESFEKVGNFDSMYFMYGEDIDLSWRYNQATSGNVYRGDLNIIHFKGISTPRKTKYIYYFYDAMVRFAQKYEYPKHNSFTNFFVTIGIRVGFFVATLRCLFSRAFDKQRRETKISHVAYVVANENEVSTFSQALSNSKIDVKTVGFNDLSTLSPKQFDAVIFDIDANLNMIINFMKQHKCQSLYGFYSKDENLSFVYEGNGCRQLI